MLNMERQVKTDEKKGGLKMEKAHRIYRDEGETDDASAPLKGRKAKGVGYGMPGRSSTGDVLQIYLAEVSKYKVLTREQQSLLAVRYQCDGDEHCAYQLVVSNLRLVVKIAMEFQRIWMNNLLDLIQEGNVGLIQAVKKFDPSRNIKFSYYSAFWIKAYILKFIMNNLRLVKLGTTRNQRKLFYQLEREKVRLTEKGFEPEPKLLSEELRVSEQEVIDMDQRINNFDVSLDAPVITDSETEWIDFLPAHESSIEDQMVNKELNMHLSQKILNFRKTINLRERIIFDRRIFSDDPLSLRELSENHRISCERVRQLESAVIGKLKAYFKTNAPDYIEHLRDCG